MALIGRSKIGNVIKQMLNNGDFEITEINYIAEINEDVQAVFVLSTTDAHKRIAVCRRTVSIPVFSITDLLKKE